MSKTKSLVILILLVVLVSATLFGCIMLVGAGFLSYYSHPIQNSIPTITTIPDITFSPTLTPAQLYKVTKVVDGDTIEIDVDGKSEKVRIIGIDTPETVDPRKPVQCFGKEASDKMKELISNSNKEILIESDPTQGDVDKYGRLLRYVILRDGTDAGLTLIANGYAHEYTYSKPYLRQEQYKQAQKDAERNKLGLWSELACNGEVVSN